MQIDAPLFMTKAVEKEIESSLNDVKIIEKENSKEKEKVNYGMSFMF